MSTDLRPFDLEFPDSGLGLLLLRDKAGNRVMRGAYGPAEAGASLNRDTDVPWRWRDWSGGGGISQPHEAISNGFAWAENAVTRWPGLVMPSAYLKEVVLTPPGGETYSAVEDSFDLGSDLFFLVGRYCVKIGSGTDPGPIVARESVDFGGTVFGTSVVATSAALFDSAVYVGTRLGGSMVPGYIWRRKPNGAWDVGDVQGAKLATVFWATAEDGVQSQRLIATNGLSTFRHLASGNALPLQLAQWSATIKVAGGRHQINSVVASNHHVWFVTSGGVADVQATGYSPILNPYWELQRNDSLNGLCSVFHNGWVYASHAQGLDRIDVASNTRHDAPGFCGPGTGTSNETPVYGQITAMTVESGWLVASVWNGTDSYVCYGRDRREMGIDGPGPIAWYLGEYYLPGEKVTHLRCHTPGSGRPRLWVASVPSAGGAPRLRWAGLAKAGGAYQELVAGLDSYGEYQGDLRWARQWKLYLTRFDYQDQAARKILLRWDGVAELLKARGSVAQDTYLQVYARADQGAWRLQGESGIENVRMTTAPRSELLPSADLVSGHVLEARVNGSAPAYSQQDPNATTKPAVLRELKVRSEIVQELRETRTYTPILGEAQSTNQNARDYHSAAENWARLVALQTSEPVRMIDEMGVEQKVRVNPGLAYREAVLAKEGSARDSRVIVADLTVALVPRTQAELSLHPAPVDTGRPRTGLRWGTGVKWGAGGKWG